MLRLAFLGSSFLRCSFLSYKFRQTNWACCLECSVLAGFLPVSLLPPSLLSLLLWLAAGTGARSCCECFFDDSTMLPHPPLLPKVFSPQIVWLLFGSFLLSSPCVVSIERKRTG